MKKIKKRVTTREKVVAAALQLIDQEGLDGLNMRELALRLNIEAASLYNHIKNKSDLLDMVQEEIIKQMPAVQENISWKIYLEQLAHAMRKTLLKFPSLITLFATRPSIGKCSLQRANQVFKVLHAAGFAYADVVFAYLSLNAFVLGHLQAERGYLAKDKAEPSLNLELLNPKEFPDLIKAYKKTGRKKYDQWFDFGVKAIITGLEKSIKINKKK